MYAEGVAGVDEFRYIPLLSFLMATVGAIEEDGAAAEGAVRFEVVLGLVEDLGLLGFVFVVGWDVELNTWFFRKIFDQIFIRMFALLRRLLRMLFITILRL